MPLWLTLIVIGIILLIVGLAVEAAKVLIWIGIIVAVISIIMSLVTRSRTR